jgi:hypothetical protein
MKSRIAAVLSAPLIFAAMGQAQNSTAGAKQLFYDTTTGVQLPGNMPPKPGPRKTTNPGPGPLKPPEVTGLAYYIEVIEPSGQIKWVPDTRRFRSGERIRFHVESKTAGRLTILQSENGAPFATLFPHPQLRGGDDRVEAGQDTVIPMRFNDKPGNLRLMLMVVSDGAAAPPREPVASGGGTPLHTQRPDPPAQPVPPVERYDPKAPMRRPPSPFAEGEVRAQLHRQAGSKALVIEIDENPVKPMKFVVNDARRDPAATSGMVALEVKLDHQP